MEGTTLFKGKEGYQADQKLQETSKVDDQHPKVIEQTVTLMNSTILWRKAS